MKGHVHQALMAQYAEDAKATDKPWELWEWSLKRRPDEWSAMRQEMGFEVRHNYRRKPKMKLIHGVEVPDISFAPKDGDLYWMPMPLSINMVDSAGWREYKEAAQHRSRNGLCYPHTGEGKQAAIAHAKAMLGITTESSRGGGREQNNEGDTVCM